MNSKYSWRRALASASKGVQSFSSDVVAGPLEHIRGRQWVRNYAILTAVVLVSDLLQWLCVGKAAQMLEVVYSLQIALAFAWILTYPPKTRWFFAACYLAATLLYLPIQIYSPFSFHPTTPIFVAIWEASVAIPILLAAAATAIRE